MDTAIKHPVLPDRVKPSFVMFDIQALMLMAERQSAWMSNITKKLWQQWTSSDKQHAGAVR